MTMIYGPSFESDAKLGGVSACRTERPDMEHFANVADHKPDRWNEDGRILRMPSRIFPKLIRIGQPGKFIRQS